MEKRRDGRNLLSLSYNGAYKLMDFFKLRRQRIVPAGSKRIQIRTRLPIPYSTQRGKGAGERAGRIHPNEKSICGSLYCFKCSLPFPEFLDSFSPIVFLLPSPRFQKCRLKKSPPSFIFPKTFKTSKYAFSNKTKNERYGAKYGMKSSMNSISIRNKVDGENGKIF